MDAIAALAALQGGAVSRQQLLASGGTNQTIAAHLRAGRWQRVHHGVMVTFTGPMPYETRVWAALLRAGDGATASHETAARLDGFAEESDDVVHITLPADRRMRGLANGVHVHYAHRLRRTRHPTRLPPRTRVEETVLDLIDVAADIHEVATWVTRACQRRVTTPDRIAAALAQRKKIRWRAATEAMVADVAAGAQSPLEVQYLRRVERAHELPDGYRQRRVAGRRVVWIDVSYGSVRVELDGRVGHVEEGAFRDRQRDNAGVASGQSTLRYGYVEVFYDACGVATEVAADLTAQGWRGSPRRCGPACALIP